MKVISSMATLFANLSVVILLSMAHLCIAMENRTDAANFAHEVIESHGVNVLEQSLEQLEQEPKFNDIILPSLLKKSIHAGNQQTFEFLLKKYGVNRTYSWPNTMCCTALGYVVHHPMKSRNRAHFIRIALAAGAELNIAANTLGRHALSLAYINHDLESLKILKIFGSSADFQFPEGMTLANFGNPIGKEERLNILRKRFLIVGCPREMCQKFEKIAKQRSIEQAVEADKYGDYGWPLKYARNRFNAGCKLISLPQVLWEEIWQYLVPSGD